MTDTQSTPAMTEAPAQDAPREGLVHVDRSANDGIAVLCLGAPSESVLTLTKERLESLDRALDDLSAEHQRGTLRGVIVHGGPERMFAAGADIKLFQTIQTADEGRIAAQTGQRLFARFEALPVPVVAAIAGPCLGGGLELALACDRRVAAEDKATQIGLPEVKLGILPGFGGTQRLPKWIGLPKALDLILQGKILDAKRAGRLGVVDRVVPITKLIPAAREEIERISKNAQSTTGAKRRARQRKGGLKQKLATSAPARALIQRQVRKKLTEGPARFYPAPLRALESCLNAFALSPSEAYAAEAKALGELMVSPQSRALVHLFFLTERSKALGKSLGKGKDSAKVTRATVVGGGVMGAGIAAAMALEKRFVRLCDLDPGTLARAKGRLGKAVAKRLKRRRMQKHEAQAALDRLAVSTEQGSLRQNDMFLEAVVENLDVKRKLFAEAIERGLPEHALLATNTSSLPIDAMAEGLPAPERVVGIHFFNPPEKMPLVEVIRGPRTSDTAAATACRLAVELGKFPIVVKDSPGFLVNRILGPYLNEAARLMERGVEPEAMDSVITEFGFPMGPARLMDEVGFDVAQKVSEVLGAAFDHNATASPLFDAMVKAGALGQKKDGGLYSKSGKEPGPGRSVLVQVREQHGSQDATPPTVAEIRELLLFPMIDEAWRCLDEGIVEAPEDVDLGMVMGTGFPPFRGGLCRYATEDVGLRHVVDRLEQLAKRFGDHLLPSEALRRAAAN